MATKVEFDVYEVFVQKSSADHHVHVGSLVAPTPDLALQNARENFLRRDKAINIWVVPRKAITASDEQGNDFLSREFDRKYREVAGYTENGRLWRMFKERAMMIEEIVEHVKAPAGEDVKKGGSDS